MAEPPRKALPSGIETTDAPVAVADLSVPLLRPADPDALLEAAAEVDVEAPPYWVHLWPSAVALAARLAREDLRGRRVLELGAGLALPSVVAQLRGADVLATDNDDDALRFAAANGVRTLHVDIAEPPRALLDAAPFDLVLLADMLYERQLAAKIALLLPRLAEPGGTVLIAYPWDRAADELQERLTARGWTTSTETTSAPGWGADGAPTPIHLLTLQAPEAAPTK